VDRNKVRGMVIGGAIGDALGMPVETWTPEKILEIYPEGIDRFIPPKNHKWFDPDKTPAGSTTDDTQLTLATMRGLISGHSESAINSLTPTRSEDASFKPYMDGISRAHCAALRITTDGWGNTTRDAVRRLANGVHWSISGQTTEVHRGTGNGVPMKCAPLAAWYASPGAKTIVDSEEFDFNQSCIDYSAMTHYTKMSAHATLCHTHAVLMCLLKTPSTFDVTEFATIVSYWIWECGEDGEYDVSHLNDTEDNLEDRMLTLFRLRTDLPSMTQAQIIAEFGNGSCYVYDSLPFSYAWFLKNPCSFQILQQVVQAGGDTDTNAKIVGELMGALHGFEAIQTYMPWAVRDLVGIDDLLSMTDKFCDTFRIE